MVSPKADPSIQGGLLYNIIAKHMFLIFWFLMRAQDAPLPVLFKMVSDHLKKITFLVTVLPKAAPRALTYIVYNI